MDLKQELGKLVELQKIDSNIYLLRRKKEKENPLHLEKIKKDFEAKSQELTDCGEKLKQAQLRKKEKDLDLAALEENVRKAKSQLYSLKTNKEYHAKLSEIESLKANVSVAEEAILTLMEEIEKVEQELAAAKEKFAEEEKKFKEQQQTIEKEMNDLGREIEQLEGKKKIVKETIDKNLLSRYEYLVENRAGLGIAPVDSEVCAACHMGVTPQKLNEIKMYKEPVYCQSCLRILYLQEDIEP